MSEPVSLPDLTACFGWGVSSQTSTSDAGSEYGRNSNEQATGSFMLQTMPRASRHRHEIVEGCG
jgi:hypothetical protein